MVLPVFGTYDDHVLALTYLSFSGPRPT
jgi:hypothetical protein